MQGKVQFNVWFNQEEREMLTHVADKLERSQSSTVRLLVRSAADELGVSQPATRLVSSTLQKETNDDG